MSHQKKSPEAISVEKHWEQAAKRLRMCETSPTSWDSGKCPEYVADYTLFGRDHSMLAHAYLDLVRHLQVAGGLLNARNEELMPETKVRTFDPESHWDECSAYPVADWQHEVAEDNTRLGYCDWVNHQIEDEVQPLLAKEDCVTLNPDELSSELKAEILRNGWINSTETVTVIFNSDLSAGSPSEDQQKKAESD